jgi:hypothetical protein
MGYSIFAMSHGILKHLHGTSMVEVGQPWDGICIICNVPWSIGIISWDRFNGVPSGPWDIVFHILNAPWTIAMQPWGMCSGAWDSALPFVSPWDRVSGIYNGPWDRCNAGQGRTMGNV